MTCYLVTVVVDVVVVTVNVGYDVVIVTVAVRFIDTAAIVLLLMLLSCCCYLCCNLLHADGVIYVVDNRRLLIFSVVLCHFQLKILKRFFKSLNRNVAIIWHFFVKL